MKSGGRSGDEKCCSRYIFRKCSVVILKFFVVSFYSGIVGMRSMSGDWE